MSEELHLLHAAKDLVEVLDKGADAFLPQKIQSTVKGCSKGAAVAAAAAGVVPGVGGAAAVAISAGFIWGMYVKINSDIGLSLSSNVLKTLASGVATNLVTSVLGSIAVSSILSFIPVAGTAISVAVTGMVCYILTLSAGFIYINLLIHLFRAGKNINNMSAEELKNAAKNVSKSKELKDVMNAAKKEYKEREKKGDFKSEGTSN